MSQQKHTNDAEPTIHTNDEGIKQLEYRIREYSRNYNISLELLEKSSNPQELIDAIFDEYIRRLDELKGIDLKDLEGETHLVEEKEKFKSLVMFATQSSLMRENAQLYEQLDKANSELRSANDQLDTKNRQLAALNEHYLNMLSFASHELRSPLISILGYAELMSDKVMGELNSDQEEAVGVITKVSKNLIDMIRNYLDLTRIETGQLSLPENREPINICDDIIAPVLVEMNEQFSKNKMNIEAKTCDPFRLDVDRDLMRIVFTNLFSNAVKYGKKGTPIKYEITEEDECYRFSISNQGVGIKPESTKDIFEKFSQALESQQWDTPKGTGLGLFIARKIVEEHGGKIWAESRFGEWFTVYFNIPRDIEKSIARMQEQPEEARIVER
ncbi:hypothetical protein JW960_17930 [candidate division KSB1 bacterium]|nr:hypothetical protein [candidate division KSB1 bacterium]